MYRFLADVTVVFHFAYASFIVLALAAIVVGWMRRWGWIRNFWFRLIHLLMIGGVAIESYFGVPCPLTVLENRLRQLAGQTTYPGSFIGTWANELLFFDASEVVFTLLYGLIFMLVLGSFLFAPPRWPSGLLRPAATDHARSHSKHG
ncbi:MAG: DUF2784 domain-containing protein [Pirellulaceae bacterium]